MTSFTFKQHSKHRIQIRQDGKTVGAVEFRSNLWSGHISKDGVTYHVTNQSTSEIVIGQLIEIALT